MSARYFLSDEAQAGARVDQCSRPEDLIAALKRVYPDLREVEHAEYAKAERRANTLPHESENERHRNDCTHFLKGECDRGRDKVVDDLHESTTTSLRTLMERAVEGYVPARAYRKFKAGGVMASCYKSCLDDDDMPALLIVDPPETETPLV